MVNFKLGEKDVPDRIGTYDLPNTGRALYPLELRRINGERGHILGSYFKRVLHTTRIIFTFVSPSLTFTIFHFFITQCDIDIADPRSMQDERQI